MRVATWNINSVRLRINNVIKFIKLYNIDVLCLQETKTINDLFPLEIFKDIGMDNYFIRGEKSYNGVAILSSIPIKKQNFLNLCNKDDTRHISVKFVNEITLHNFYVPAGGDIPDLDENYKFRHKLDFISEMTDYFKKDKTKKKIILGDFNIAPLENDVWSHKQLLNVVSHTALETEALNNLLVEGKWIDIIRQFISQEKKLFSWWSYRNKDWRKSNS